MKLTKVSTIRAFSLFLFVLSAFLLIVTMNNNSLWLDEVAAVVIHSPRELLQSLSDAQMPLLYWLIFLSRVLLGTSEFAIRLPTVLIALGLVNGLPFLLRRRGVAPWISFLPSLFLLLNPTMLFYAQEARAYMIFVALFLSWALLREEFQKRFWLGLSIALGFLLSNTFAIGYVLIVLSADLILSWRKRKPLPTADLAAVIVFLPVLAFAFSRSLRARVPGLERGSWLELALSFETSSLQSAWRYFFGHAPWVYAILSLLSLAAAIYLAWKKRDFLWVGTLLGLVLWGRLIAGAGWPFYDRYLILLVPLMLVPGALASAMITKRDRSLFAGGVLLLVASIVNPNVQVGIKPWPGILPQLFSPVAMALNEQNRNDWKRVLAVLDALAQPGETYRFFSCSQCNPVPVVFYSFGTRVVPELRFVESGCGDWLIGRGELPADFEKCGFKPIAVFTNRVSLYGKRTELLRPLRSKL